MWRDHWDGIVLPVGVAVALVVAGVVGARNDARIAAERCPRGRLQPVTPPVTAKRPPLPAEQPLAESPSKDDSPEASFTGYLDLEQDTWRYPDMQPLAKRFLADGKLTEREHEIWSAAWWAHALPELKPLVDAVTADGQVTQKELQRLLDAQRDAQKARSIQKVLRD